MRRPTALLLLGLFTIVILSYTLHRVEIKFNIDGDFQKRFEAAWKATDAGSQRTLLVLGCSSQKTEGGSSAIQPTKHGALHHVEVEWAKKEEEIKDILRKLDQLMPNVTFRDVKTTTSAKNSQAAILNRKEAYCVGDPLRIRLDLYDHLGQRKGYGGDFLRARISSPNLKAGASGLIQDLRNGSYLVDFTLSWEGNASVSLLLIHPSEAVSALWAARKKGYDKISFTGRFLNGTSEVNAECGFQLNQSLGLCTYLDERDQEAFYCVKPKKVPCEAFVRLKSHNNPISYLTALERSLLTRLNLGVQIPHRFGDVHVVLCKKENVTREKCTLGMNVPFPSGFAWQNQWHPLSCDLRPFDSLDDITSCLKGKLLYLLGDSTGRQWFEYMTRRVTSLRNVDSHGSGKHRNLIAVDLGRNIQIQWKKHHHPLVTASEYMVTDHNYIAQEIDNMAGDKDMAVVIAIGQHFRPFPIELFLRRAINVRSALRRLLLRSPDTKIILKGENIRELDVDQERFSDFHGYVQYLAAKEIFQDLKGVFIDAWDMTVAYGTSNVHPPDHVVWNEIKMFFNYIC